MYFYLVKVLAMAQLINLWGVAPIWECLDVIIKLGLVARPLLLNHDGPAEVVEEPLLLVRV